MTLPNTKPTTVSIGTILKNPATGEVFRVKCNCANVTPRSHTLRSVTANLSRFVIPTKQEMLDGPIL